MDGVKQTAHAYLGGLLTIEPRARSRRDWDGPDLEAHTRDSGAELDVKIAPQWSVSVSGTNSPRIQNQCGVRKLGSDQFPG